MGNYETKLINSIGKEYRKNYPKFEIKEDLICPICNKNKVPIELQKPVINICRNCYEIQKKQEYNSMIEFLKGRKVVNDISEIIPNKLYLGNYYSATLKEALKEKGITHILMVGYYLSEIYPNDFTYKSIEIDDAEQEDIFKYFYSSINLIEKSNIVYIHCKAGISRSASFVIAYIMFHFKYNLEEAFDYVQKRREIICPNEGFMMQLKDLENVLKYCNYDLEEFRKINTKLYQSQDVDDKNKRIFNQ